MKNVQPIGAKILRLALLAQDDILAGCAPDVAVGSRWLVGGVMTPPYRCIYETDTPFLKSEIALFSNLDTWAWEMPRAPATSIWVLPS